jgi:DNA-binding LytR/AlgR family response regulator
MVNATNSESRQHERRESHVIAVNGKPLKLTRRELLAFYGSRWFLLSVFLFCALLVVLKPDDLESELPIWFRIVFWIVCILVYLLLLNRMFRLVQGLGKWLNLGVKVPTVFIHSVLMPPVVITATYAISVFEQRPEILAELSAWDLLRNIFLALAFETLVVGLALPAWRREQVALAGGAAENAFSRDWIRLGDQRFELAKLLHVKSAEHYLEIFTDTRTELVRMRMRDFTAIVPPGIGIQTHRSHWVSFQAVAEYKQSNGRKIILLRNGAEIPVSRGRQNEVETLLSD